tara:strand:- start:1115 stop:1714 length:600 start_codon:yes stop_codon:yes gene_type:complete
LKNNLLLGTNNTGKLKEFIFYIKHFNLFNGYKVLNLNEFNNIGEPIEDGKTFEENCEIKSKYFLSKTNTLVLCDDSGFFVNKLNNYPGIRTAREAKKLGGEQKVIDFIFSKFENLSCIDATFFCSICVLGENQRYIVSGSISGFIIKEKRGNNGFGYDPYFIPTHYDKTFAEMNKKQKLLNSHRYDAFKKLSNQILQDN